MQITLSIVLASSISTGHSTGTIPDDVRYMIEDLYGINKSKWPTTTYEQDVNGDQLSDWIAQQSTCTAKESCQVDLFICKKGTDTHCIEYCYAGSGELKKLLNKPNGLVCESTC